MKKVLEVAYKSFDHYKQVHRGFDVKIKKYIIDNTVLEITLDFKEKIALVLEPIQNAEKTFWIKSWFNNEISTETLTEHMENRYQWVQYFLKDFLNEVLNHAQKRA